MTAAERHETTLERIEREAWYDDDYDHLDPPAWDFCERCMRWTCSCTDGLPWPAGDEHE